jgi:hypothetical protein
MRFSLVTVCVCLITLGCITAAEARGGWAAQARKNTIRPAGKLGFNGNSVRRQVFKIYKQRNWHRSNFRVKAIGVSRSRKTRVFAVINKRTGEVKLAYQSVKSLRLRFKTVKQATPFKPAKPTTTSNENTRPNGNSGYSRGYNAETYSRALSAGLTRSSTYSPSGRGGYRSIP